MEVTAQSKRKRPRVATAPAWKLRAVWAPSDLPSPVTTDEKLRWIEIRGGPDYLAPPGVQSVLDDGRIMTTYAPEDRAA